MTDRCTKLDKHDDYYSFGYDIAQEHKNDLTSVYDSYFEFSPLNVKRIFLLFFPLNRLFKLLLVYCLFYHSIWWLPNSTSNNLAINYSNINAYVFCILLHYNFYDLFVGHLFIRLFCFNLFNYFRLIPNEKLKLALNLVEFSIYLFITLSIFYYFKFILNVSINFLTMIMCPHIFFYFYKHFDIDFKLFNVTLFTNQPVIKKLNQTEYYHELKLNESNETATLATTSKKIYTDCSNMSIMNYLNQPLLVPNLLTQNSQLKQAQQSSNVSPADHSNQTLKIIRQSLHRAKIAKSRMINFSLILFSFPRNLISQIQYLFNNLYENLIKSFQVFLLTFPRSNRLTMRKRNLFDYSYKNDFTNYIQHICQKNSIGLREECNWLSFEFKNRFKQVCMHTFESIYYNFFIARLFVPSDLNVREKEFYMYFVSSVLSTLLSYWLYYIPYSFLKTLSNNAHHLGYWCRVSDSEKASIKWMNTKSYACGDRVLYAGKSYETRTELCAAIPSNKFYTNYYILFSSPTKTIRVLLCLESVHMVMLLLIIFLNRRWYAIALSILEVICNSHLFFIIMRDFLVSINERNFNLKQR